MRGQRSTTCRILPEDRAGRWHFHHLELPRRAGADGNWLLDPQPISAATARDWGVVTEVVPDGTALSRAKALAARYLAQPAVTRRNTRIHFIQPLKERLVREVGYGLSLEGASAAALVKSMSGG